MKKFYVKFRDTAGHESLCQSDSIELIDSEPIAQFDPLISPSAEPLLMVDVNGSYITAYKYKWGPTVSVNCADSSGYSA